MQKKRSAHLRVPGVTDWAGYDDDLDVRYAHKLLFGKSIPEVKAYFAGGRSIERSSELLYMPRRAFQYYVFAFAEYLRSPEAAGDSDAASSFLRLTISREKKDPGSVSQVFPELRTTIEFVASNQEYFDANPDIYGKLADLGSEITVLCEAPHARV